MSYRVEVRDTKKGWCRIAGVFLYEKLENAIYEGTHFGYGVLESIDESKMEKVESERPRAVILNDEFAFRWGNGIEVRIKTAKKKDIDDGTPHLLYEGKVYNLF